MDWGRSSLLSSRPFVRFVHKRMDTIDASSTSELLQFLQATYHMHQNQNGCALVAMSQFSHVDQMNQENWELWIIKIRGLLKELQRGNEQCPGISKETEYCYWRPPQSSDNNDKRNGERLWKNVLHVLLAHVSLICLLLNLAFNQIDDGHKDVKPSKKS